MMKKLQLYFKMNQWKQRFIQLLCLFFSLSYFSLIAQDETIEFQKAYQRIDTFVRQYMEENNVPGMAMAITSKKRLLKDSYYGFEDIKTRKPVTSETLFQIGSVTKSFTAMALMQLKDEGKFDPHVPVKNYIPWFGVKSKYEPITPHHLLTHTAGIPGNREIYRGECTCPCH
jgi:CubicO group peptidase (beta-lactamase class C family)